MQKPTAKHPVELRESYGRVRDRIESVGEVKDSTRPTESAQLSHGGSQRLNPKQNA